jgi:AcrR family transcriptional regulator
MFLYLYRLDGLNNLERLKRQVVCKGESMHMSSSAKRGRPRKTEGVSTGSTRDNLLTAAEEVVISQGAQALTLDAVYKQAGISKGGLLYHFPNKEALIDGMIARYLQRSQTEEESLKAAREPMAPGAAARAAISQLSRQNPGDDKIGAALLAAVATDLDRLAPVRAVVRRQFEEMREDPIGFETAAIIELAVTGLWFMELLKLTPLASKDRKHVLEALTKLTRREWP